MGLMGGCMGATEMQLACSEVVWGAVWGRRLTCAIWGDLAAIWLPQVPRIRSDARKSPAAQQWARGIMRGQSGACRGDQACQ